MSAKARAHAKFGDELPFAEPAWYQGAHSPYYDEGHVRFRAVMRAFVEGEILPHVDEWIATGCVLPRATGFDLI